MPTEVTGSDGVSYHLWQLGAYTTPEPEDTIEFAAIDCPLTDGYRSSILCGPTAGVKSWKLQFPTLASEEILPNTSVGPKSKTTDRENYVRMLYADNKITGTPFVYLDTVSNTYHFVDFVDKELTMQRMRVKIYVTGLTIRERRKANVTLPSP